MPLLANFCDAPDLQLIKHKLVWLSFLRFAESDFNRRMIIIFMGKIQNDCHKSWFSVIKSPKCYIGTWFCCLNICFEGLGIHLSTHVYLFSLPFEKEWQPRIRGVEFSIALCLRSQHCHMAYVIVSCHFGMILFLKFVLTFKQYFLSGNGAVRVVPIFKVQRADNLTAYEASTIDSEIKPQSAISPKQFLKRKMKNYCWVYGLQLHV